jgi:chemotaxis family two-component system response regulator Rcp1
MSQSVSRPPLEILLVEDNPADVRIASEALKLAGFEYRLHVVIDGEEALDFLLNHGTYARAPHPDLVLLDLKLPKLGGLAVLGAIRKMQGPRTTVVVLTGSTLRDDRTRAADLDADLFVTKPVGVEACVEQMKRFRDLALAR